MWSLNITQVSHKMIYFHPEIRFHFLGTTCLVFAPTHCLQSTQDCAESWDLKTTYQFGWKYKYMAVSHTDRQCANMKIQLIKRMIKTLMIKMSNQNQKVITLRYLTPLPIKLSSMKFPAKNIYDNIILRCMKNDIKHPVLCWISIFLYHLSKTQIFACSK